MLSHRLSNQLSNLNVSASEIANPVCPQSRRDEQRLRARRIRVDTPPLGPVRATAEHDGLGTFEAKVEDISLAGLAMVLQASPLRSGLVVGDRLERLRIELAGRTLYDGTAIVRHVTQREADLVVGVDLESNGVDLGEIYRWGARCSFADRWRVVDDGARLTHIAPAFRAWVANLRCYLEMTRTFLLTEERSIAGEDRLSREQVTDHYLQEAAPRMIARMAEASTELAALVSHLSPDQHSSHRAYCRAQLGNLFSEAPFMRRASEKPLGYAGDYEMMNMLYRHHAEGESLFAKVLNLYATHEAAARANINRITYLGEKIRAIIATARRPRVRIASIGCGPAREIAAILEDSPALGPRLEVALIDQEERSIAYCERTLAPLALRTGARVRFIRASIRRLLTAKNLRQALGEQEFIYSAGLFDYLNDRSFRGLLGGLYQALVPSGLIAVGNVSTANPSRWAMEYFSEWFLIHRSPDELCALGQTLDPVPARVEVDAEPLGVNLFLLIRAAAA